jgi:tetratricopeptide (TPR) repeat protein
MPMLIMDDRSVNSLPAVYRGCSKAGTPMASRRSHGGISELWQLPLFLTSIGLFGYAAYLFIDPHAGPTIDQKIDVAKKLLKDERPEAAVGQLNNILTAEKLDHDHEGLVHLLLAEAVDDLQKLKHVDLKTYHQQIIEQTGLATGLGVKPSYEIERRLGENFEALGKPTTALEHYRKAMAMDPSHALRLQRKVIDLQLQQTDPSPAMASLETYLQSPGLADGEKAWALCNQAKLWVDQGEFVKARALLDRAVKMDNDPATLGQVNYYLGYCAYKLGDGAEAERNLRVARQQLKVDQPLDADAAYLLGKIFEERSDPQTAESFYREVLIGHPESPVALPSLMGRGMCRLDLGQQDPGLSDLHDMTRQLLEHPERGNCKPDAITSLGHAATLLSSSGNYRGAIEMLDCEQQLESNPPPAFFGRLSTVYEQRADQLTRLVDGANAAEKVRRAKEIRELLTKAGDASIAYSRALTLIDDKTYGDSLWRGIDLYDRAANLPSAVSALELFVAERPDDSLAPQALLRLGQAYQAMGLFDKAIAAFQRNQFRYPNSLAASKSAVPLAQAYIAKGPQFFAKAESVLKSVVENNPVLTPEAEEFKQALFELAQLYYHTDRFEDSIARLEELAARYPNDARLGQLLFLMADSYRKSAGLLDLKPAVANASQDQKGVAIDLAEAASARKERLAKAKAMYDRVVDLYRDTPPTTELDKLYNKLSHFYRADCVFDSGQYEEAIRLYDQAAFRYQDDPSSLAAYVQIVNAYYALGKPDEAKAANERAKWLLKRMPTDAFSNGNFEMPKEYWENQLKWSSESGIW